MKVKSLFVAPLALAAVGLFAIAPNSDRTRRSRLRPFLRRDIAHRGLHDREKGVAENSLPAFAAAVAAEYGIELDVRLSKDGVPVVFHDDDTARLCGVGGKIAAMTLAELRELSLDGTDEKIPTLEEALAVIDGKVPLLIELKDGHGVDDFCRKVMSLLYTYPGVYMIQSFSPLILKWFRIHEPYVLRSQLSCDFFAPERRRREPVAVRFAATELLGNVISRPDLVAYAVEDAAGVGFTLCRKIFEVPTAGWTVQSAAARKRAETIFDTVVFEGEGRPQ